MASIERKKATVVFNQLDVVKTSQTYNVSLNRGRILSGHNFQNFDFWGAQSFLRFFSPSFRLVLPRGFRLGFAAPEAKHRCTGQPRTATMPWWSGSGRPRRPWMRRTKTAVASEEDLGGKTSWGMGFRCEGNVKWRCWWFKIFDRYCFQFLWRVSAKIHLRQCLVLFKKHGEVNEDVDGSSEWNVDGLSVWWIYCFTFFLENLPKHLHKFVFCHPVYVSCTPPFPNPINDFRLAVFCSDHCNTNLITTFQHCSMDPDILTFTSLIVWNVCFWRSYAQSIG